MGSVGDSENSFLSVLVWSRSLTAKSFNLTKVSNAVVFDSGSELDLKKCFLKCLSQR